VNTGRYKFTVDEKQRVVYGIGAIKGVGEGPIESIIQARTEGGPFRDLFDFCMRVDLKKLNRRVMEKLIKAGAMDKLGPNRASLMASLEKAMRQADQHAKAEEIGQHDLFGVVATEPDDIEHEFEQVPEWPEPVWLDGERETLGLYLTGHPVNRYRKELANYTRGRIADITETGRGNAVAIAGLVLDVRTMVNRKGQRWAVVTLDDKSARMEVRLFAKVFEQYEHLLQKDRIIWAKGEVSFDNFSGGNTMNANELMGIEEARAQFVSSLDLDIDLDSRPELASTLPEIIQQAMRGTCPVRLHCRISGAAAELKADAQWYVEPTDDLLYSLKDTLGESQVRLEFE